MLVGDVGNNAADDLSRILEKLTRLRELLVLQECAGPQLTTRLWEIITSSSRENMAVPLLEALHVSDLNPEWGVRQIGECILARSARRTLPQGVTT